ncbi:hypothetical protein CP8484711_2078B, partial [Chlamydia psittaci 84-8471/1]
PIRI